MKKILILGATGFVGKHLCEQLARAGWRLSVATRRRGNAQGLLTLPGLNLLEFDVHDEAALTRALAGHDAVVNLVAILHGSEATFARTHVELPRKLARACAAAGVPRLLQVSALGADPQNPQAAPSMYLRSKSLGEAELLRAAAENPNLQLTLLRPSVIFGADDKFLNVFAKLQRALPVLPLAGAATRFQPVWVGDVVQSVLRCLQDLRTPLDRVAPRVFELCGPEVYTLKELVQIAARASRGRARPVVALPGWLGRLQATLMELAPGEPVMSRDNLDSMRCDNVGSGAVPGLAALGISAAPLLPLAMTYLAQNRG